MKGSLGGEGGSFVFLDKACLKLESSRKRVKRKRTSARRSCNEGDIVV